MSDEFNPGRRRFLGTAAMGFVTAEFALIGSAKAQSTETQSAEAVELPIEGELPRATASSSIRA